MKLFLQCSFALSLVDYPSHPWDGRRWVASRGGTEVPIAMDLGLSSECPLLDPGGSVLSFPAEPQDDSIVGPPSTRGLLRGQQLSSGGGLLRELVIWRSYCTQ